MLEKKGLIGVRSLRQVKETASLSNKSLNTPRQAPRTNSFSALYLSSDDSSDFAEDYNCCLFISPLDQIEIEIGENIFRVYENRLLTYDEARKTFYGFLKKG